MTTVIKIGGSLQFSSNLEKICKTIDKLSKKHHLVVIPGGGRFSDLVRDLENEHDLSGETAHLMAIKSMEVYGITLNELMPELQQAENLEIAKNRNVVLFPYKEVRECELESSWEVTSDSIAAWICGEIGCDRLVLIKSVDGIRKSGRLLSSIGTGDLEEIGQSVVDSKLSGILKKYEISCWILNGGYPERIRELLKSQETKGTKISLEGEH
ncbi:hypothetical protein AKJ52_00230 [candidate division MSBL1 archaeon SCGC-AAA382C18]|uniref:Aspartate/glutamate/uridylate kinase domain-containing protein n=1 Tax=candidate division MSBL1 archaeon SCGC-AAA382C18 TaxID=1698281 RepID=A0A133VLW8_9EURY|nr:hypothetical protein AKJ52_00230 [candidate division MSBL1 archaeon SCGC-AAA382C18]